MPHRIHYKIPNDNASTNKIHRLKMDVDLRKYYASDVLYVPRL